MVEHKAHDHQHFQQVTYDHKKTLAENTRYRLNIIHCSGSKTSHRTLIVVLHPETQHKLEHLGSDVFDDALSQPICKIDKGVLEDHLKTQYYYHQYDVEH